MGLAFWKKRATDAAPEEPDGSAIAGAGAPGWAAPSPPDATAQDDGAGIDDLPEIVLPPRNRPQRMLTAPVAGGAGPMRREKESGASPELAAAIDATMTSFLEKLKSTGGVDALPDPEPDAPPPVTPSPVAAAGPPAPLPAPGPATILPGPGPAGPAAPHAGPDPATHLHQAVPAEPVPAEPAAAGPAADWPVPDLRGILAAAAAEAEAVPVQDAPVAPADAPPVADVSSAMPAGPDGVLADLHQAAQDPGEEAAPPSAHPSGDAAAGPDMRDAESGAEMPGGRARALPLAPEVPAGAETGRAPSRWSFRQLLRWSPVASREAAPAAAPEPDCAVPPVEAEAAGPGAGPIPAPAADTGTQVPAASRFPELWPADAVPEDGAARRRKQRKPRPAPTDGSARRRGSRQASAAAPSAPAGRTGRVPRDAGQGPSARLADLPEAAPIAMDDATASPDAPLPAPGADLTEAPAAAVAGDVSYT
ncbi:MAG: hypothetical protein N2422_12960, partial [Rhodobacteraceae bacterium]|nr:hypothetical protein [Paracoccaceae bacterium]